MAMTKEFDCVVCGEICVDFSVRPIDQHTPLCEMETVRVDPIELGGGGIVANSGMALARLGIKTAALASVGDDTWSNLLIALLEKNGVDTAHVVRRANTATSATAVLIGDDGEHTFAYHAGASRQFDRQLVLDNIALFERSQFALFGYYALMPELEHDLPEVLARIQQTGCRTALDAAGGGGTIEPLNRILPHLDIYIPNEKEGRSQTGKDDPQEMIAAYRQFCPNGILGIKLGERGALLSPSEDELIDIMPVSPPGPVVDTTGAGDSFYAGLITGLVRGLSVVEAGQLAAATGACCVTQIGAVGGIRDYDFTRNLAREV